MRFERVDGVLVEPLGEAWAAFSPASGETSLLNNESAAILEVLAGCPRQAAEVVALLAEDCGQSAESLASAVHEHWQRLVDGGLVRPVAVAGSTSA